MTRELPTGISRRGKLLWVTYAIPAPMAARYGCKRVQRESAKTGDLRAAKSFLAQRRREVKNGTWTPPRVAGGGTVQAYFDRWTADRKLAGLRSASTDKSLMKLVLPVLGPMRLGDVRRPDILHVMGRVRATPSERGGGPRAPRSVHRVYAKLRAMFGSALRAELILTNPCTLRMDGIDLPRNRDANPRWRKSALYARGELEQLISDERIPAVRRMRYALIALTGMRAGEAVARTWGDYDPDVEPLGRLLVETQLGEEDGDEDRELKTGTQREVPVHPLLAKLLAEWKLRGYELAYGRKPTPDALILLSWCGKPLEAGGVWTSLRADLDALGLRRRRSHDMRRSFISLALADGADKYFLKFVTHGAPKADAFDSYVTAHWPKLCEQVACLKLGLRGAEVRNLRTARSAHPGAQPANGPQFTAEK